MFKLNKKSETVVDPKFGKLEETYWNKKHGATLSVNIEKLNSVTNKFELVPVTHHATGLALMVGNEYQYLSEVIKFTPFTTSGKIPFDVSWCFYKVYELTPEYIKRELKRLHSINSLFTNEEKMNIDNPQAFQTYKEKQVLKNENKEKDIEIIKLKAKLAEEEAKNKGEHIKKVK